MQKEILVVRKVDPRIYRKFRQRALKESMNVGRAITEAMEFWMNEKEKIGKHNIKTLLKLNGIIKTKRAVQWSQEIDKILYR